MDASRYFDAMHNAMSTLHTGAQLLLTVRLQDTCGNDAYLEVKQLPGEQSALVCYSTMGRRCLNFQLFRKGWQLCHNAEGQLTGRFPSSADSLLSQTDFRAYCREDRLDAARTQRLVEELGQRAGTNYVGTIPQNARTGAQITVESYLGCGARWSYWNQDAYLADDNQAMIGTINLDYRSLVHHFENGVWMYDCESIKDLKSDIDDTLSKSIEVTPEMLKTNLLQRFIRAVVRIFAPML